MDVIDYLGSECALALLSCLKDTKADDFLNPCQSIRAHNKPLYSLLTLGIYIRHLGHTLLPINKAKEILSNLLNGQECSDVEELFQFIDDFSPSKDFDPDLIGALDSKSHFVLFESKEFNSLCLTTRAMYKINNSIGTNLSKLILRDDTPLPFTANAELNDEQNKALNLALTSPSCIITGGAGTGKSRVIETIISEFLKKSKAIIGVCAPTGRAIRLLAEKFSGDESTKERLFFNTIHRYIGIGKPDGFELNELDLVIIDETSMVDSLILEKFLAKINPKSRLIFVGDINQLPSVEEGSSLNALLSFFETKKPQFIQRLSKNMRVDNSGINDLRIQIPQSIIENNFNPSWLENMPENLNFAKSTQLFQFSQEMSFSHKIKIRDQIILFYAKEFEAAKKPDEIPLIICSTREGIFGSLIINQELQKHFNISSHNPRRNKTPIMILKNDARTKLSNGDRGFVKTTSNGLEIEFEDKSFDLLNLSHYELSYAITIHKSQGSTYKKAIVLLGEENANCNRQLFYTALTRTRDAFMVIGSEKAYTSALAKDGTRYSSFS